MSAEIKLDAGTLTVSASPHIRCDESIAKIMWAVNMALAPLCSILNISFWYAGFNYYDYLYSVCRGDRIPYSKVAK